jgi:NADH-quinone oxidoreductase subunit H
MNLTIWSDPVNFIANWLHGLLIGIGLAPGLVSFILTLLGVVALAMGGMLFSIFLIWYERKLLGRIQDRYGPNRVGPWGLVQPIADMLKIFTKEYITPIGADKVPFNLAPVLAVASVLLMWAVIPFAKPVYGVDLNVAILYLVAVGGLGSLGILFAGWSSNNKYALLGAFRVVAQLISYEVPMVLSLLVPVILARSMSLNGIVESQAHGFWFMFVSPLAALIFFITSVAEVGRAPFDLIEAESEIVAGFNIEYSGLKFGMFFVGEFLHAFTISLLFATIFMGGWQGPAASTVPFLGFVYYAIKTFIVYFVVILFRGSLPRFRIDQMMDLNWKILTPIALVTVMATAIGDKALESTPLLVHGIALLALNAVIAIAALEIMRRTGQRNHKKNIHSFEPKPVVAEQPPI